MLVSIYLVIVLILIAFISEACQQTSQTITRDGDGVISIEITSEGSLTVTLEEAEAFQAVVTFDGQDSVDSVLSESSSTSENLTVWTLDLSLSAPTESPSSSANSQVFFSGATSAVLAPLAGLYSAVLVSGSCAEAATVALSLPAGWAISDEGAKRVVLEYSGPHSYGYDLVITLPDETVSTWTTADEEALIAKLRASFTDQNLFFTVTTRVDANGQLVLTVSVLGFSTLSSATVSYDGVSVNGLNSISSSSSSQFVSMIVVVGSSAPSVSCSMGFSENSAGICTDIDGCIDNTCGNGRCADIQAPGNGYSCACDAGYFDHAGTCENVDGCSVNSCGSNGACVDVAPPGTGFTCNCNTGYVSTNLVCVNEDGCATYPSTNGSCSASDSGARCADIAPPGTGYTCTCSSGYNVLTDSPASSSAPQCAQMCPSNPSQTGYVVASGTSMPQNTRTVTCATGYTGTASSITCGSNLAWSSSSGCTIVSCPSSPTQTGYTIAAGASTYGSTRTVSCSSGYTGTASSITCQSGASWTSSSGCTIGSCPSSPTQTGYTIAAGASTYGSMRTVSCSTGYGGTATSITCGSNLAWSSSSGCTTVCGDSRKYGSEGCDDGNTNSMDGCSSSCAVEAGYTCSGGTTSTRDTCVDTNDCSGNTCRSGSTCSDLRPPNNGYDCVCTNSRANEVLRWPSSGATTNDRVNLPSSTYFVDGATKTALTISLWMQSSDTEYALLSYNVANQDNTILLWYDNTDGLQLWLNNAYRVLHSPSATYRVNDNMWHMLTVTWLSSSGAIDVWIDGVRRYQYTGFQTGFAIPTSGGHMVLGQEQDSVNGGYVLSQGYVGYMAQFYLWTSVLTNDQIATLYLGTAAPNVAIAYCDVVGNVAGGITFVLQRDANMCVDSVMYWNGASTTNRVDIVANTFFPNSNTCDWTFSGWFKFTGSAKGLISWATSGQDNAFLLYYYTSSADFYINGAIVMTFTYPSGQAWTDNTWRHIVFTREDASGRNRIYVNGVLMASSESNIGYCIPGGVIVLGQEQDCEQGCWDVNQAYSGSIGMFYGYNREATQSDVSALYIATSVANVPSGWIFGFDSCQNSAPMVGSVTFASRAAEGFPR